MFSNKESIYVDHAKKLFVKLVYRFDFQEYNESNTAYSIVRTFNSNGYKKCTQNMGKAPGKQQKRPTYYI